MSTYAMAYIAANATSRHIPPRPTTPHDAAGAPPWATASWVVMLCRMEGVGKGEWGVWGWGLGGGARCPREALQVPSHAHFRAPRTCVGLHSNLDTLLGHIVMG